MLKKIKNKLIRILTKDILVNLKKFSYEDTNRVENLQEFQKKHKYTILPLSYFEPIPDLRNIDLNNEDTPELLLNINMRYDFSFTKNNFEKILSDNFIPDWLRINPYFSIPDMAAYGSFIEKYKPSKIIEIGAGNSTCFAKKFTEHLNLQTEIFAIEPNPNEHLLDSSENCKIALVRKKLQDINQSEKNLIRDLNENDILFIDTSHISVLGSEIHTIYLNLLPALKKGVLIHIHDIFLPYDYISSMYYKRGMFFNEQYLLASILANCNSYTSLYSSFNTYVNEGETMKKILKDLLNESEIKRGGSFWMQKN